MKRLLLLITICVSSVSYQLYSQSCTPGVNFQDSTFGIYPDTIVNLPSATEYLFYSTDLNFMVPAQITADMDPTGNLVGSNINGYVVDAVLGLPAGLSYVCNNAGCSYAGGENGCANIYGTPLVGDTVCNITIEITVLAQTVFGPIQQTVDFDGYYIQVAGCLGSSESNLSVITCDSYNLNGQIYNMSGNYTQVLTNSNSVGCDSTINLDLTINNSSSNSNVISESITTCGSYTLNGQTYTTPGSYTQTLTNMQGCDSTIFLEINAIPNDNIIPICAVGTNNGMNRVVWEKPTTILIDSFYIYKESVQAGIYDLVGAKAYADSALFTDSNSDPSVQAYRYKISSVDTCGNESPLSQDHKTIHLTINQGVGSDWNLIWSHYEGFSFTTYEIYRGTNPSNMIFLTSIQNTLNSYTDQSAPAGNIYYQIVAVNPNGCNPAKSNDYSSSKSNIANTSETSSITELVSQVLVHPNPTSTSFTITSKNSINSSFKLMDIQGKVVLTGKIESTEETVDISKLSKGQYNLVFEDESISPISIIKN